MSWLRDTSVHVVSTNLLVLHRVPPLLYVLTGQHPIAKTRNLGISCIGRGMSFKQFQVILAHTCTNLTKLSPNGVQSMLAVPRTSTTSISFSIPAIQLASFAAITYTKSERGVAQNKIVIENNYIS